MNTQLTYFPFSEKDSLWAHKTVIMYCLDNRDTVFVQSDYSSRSIRGYRLLR